MTKLFFLCAALITAGAARENPFFATHESHSLPITSNIPDTLPKLTSRNFTLPNQARVLKEVSFTIQNLDGSIETRTMNIEQSVDWHNPITISQFSRSSVAETAANSMADFGFIRFDTKGKRLTIRSSESMVRHFPLTDPNRIVVDFKRTKPFSMQEKILSAPPYSSVSIANHGKFVRATILLDGRYNYILNNNGGVISINCR